MKAIIVAFITLLLTGTGMYFVLPDGGPSKAQLSRMKGSDSYYEVEEQSYSPGQVIVRLRGDRERHLILDFDLTFYPSIELEKPEELFEKRETELRSELLISLSEEDHEALLESEAGKYSLKRRLRRLTEKVLFPDHQGRVRRIWLKKLLIQTV